MYCSIKSLKFLLCDCKISSTWEIENMGKENGKSLEWSMEWMIYLSG